MKKIIKLIRMVFLIITFSSLGTGTCYAEVDVNAIQGYFNGIVAQQQIYHSNNPKYAERNNTSESMDPITGNLIIRQTDIQLTGKDGLDLSIGRIYNSGQADYVNKVNISYSTQQRADVVNCYFVNVALYDKQKGEMKGIIQLGPYFDIGSALSVYDDIDGAEDEFYFYAAIKVIYSSTTVYYTDYTVVKNNYTDKYSYNITRYNLGAGWSLALPSVQIERDNGSIYIYYHDGTGAAYQVTGTSDSGKSNLDGYQGNDVRFLEDNGSYINGDNIRSKYKFINAEFTISYFAEDGRLLGIKDRFGNEIKVRHKDVQIYEKTFPLISQITDSVGRVLNFSYNNNNIEITVSAPNESNQLKVVYTKYYCTQYLYDNGAVESYQYPTLDYITDPMGVKTYYINYYYYNGNKWPMERATFTAKDLTGLPEKMRYILGGITYSGSKTCFEYEKIKRNLGTEGSVEEFRLKSRHDEIQRYNQNTKVWEWLSDNNRIDYSYNGDSTGSPDYLNPNQIPETYQFWSASSFADGLTVKNLFNGKKQLIQEEKTAANKERQIVKNLEFDPNFKELPLKREYTDYSSDGALAHTYFQEMTYTSWGGISSLTPYLSPADYNDYIIKTRHTTFINYRDSMYIYFPTNKEWYQGEGTRLWEAFWYDSLGRLQKKTNANGSITQYSYNNDSNNNKIVEETMELENNKVAKTKKIYGSETGFAYPKEIISYFTDEAGTTKETKTTYTYNILLGQILTETDGSGKTITYTYDNLSRILQIKQPDFLNNDGISYSVKEEYSYVNGYNWDYINGTYLGMYGTTVNTATVYTEKVKNTSTYYKQYAVLYDVYGNAVLQKNRATGVIKNKYTYDNMQRVVSSTDATGNVVSQTYEPWGGVSELTDASGNLYVNDNNIKMYCKTSYFIAKDNIAVYRNNKSDNTYKEDYVEEYYDQYGRNTKRSVYENWPARSGELSELFQYDFVGNLVGYTDPKRNLNKYGFTESYEYDGSNKIIKVKNAMNQITDIKYTTKGDISSVSLHNDVDNYTPILMYSKAYDELGDIYKKTYSNGFSDYYSYNNVGVLTGITDREGIKQQLSYDGLNQLKVKTISSSIRYEYLYNNPYGYSTVQLYNNGEEWPHTMYYYYNADGQTTECDTQDYLESSVLYGYDTAGRTSYTSVMGKDSEYQTSYSYNRGRLEQVRMKSWLSGSSRESSTLYEYYPDGKIKRITYPILNDNMQLTSEYSYNKLGRLTSLVNKKGSTILSQFIYYYDANGNITSVNDGNETVRYEYDALNRLVNVIKQDGTKTGYSYNLRGDRSVEDGGYYNYNYVNTTYSYDVENKLKKVKKDNITTMEYYPDGMRASKETNNGTIYFIYDNNGRVVAEGNDQNNDITSGYYWGPDRVLAKENKDGSKYYYLYNGHGDVIQMVDTNGKIVNNYKYDVWGNLLVDDESVPNLFKYAGEVYDEETGLYYLRARYYNPQIGRFLGEDAYEGQITNPLSLNHYTYCYNNPLSYVDKDGHNPLFYYAYLYIMSICSAPDTQMDLEFLAADLTSGDYTAAAFDMIGILVPGGTGFGQSTKSVKKIVTGLLNFIGETDVEKYFDDAVKLPRNLDDLTRGFSKSYGDLSKATKYGIESYSSLSKQLKGTGLQAHHIVEKRLAPILGIKDSNSMLSVVVTKSEHQKFTNEWRKYIPYGTDYRAYTKGQIWEIAQIIYKDYPALLKAAKNTIY